MRWFVFLLLLVCAGCASVNTRRPNVLFLFADDQRADTISALGNPRIKTPNIDGLVGRGFAFTRAYGMGSQVGAVCIPSRAMLMTGRHLFAATRPAASPTIPEDHRMWPEVFRAAGYKTIGIGKWHNDRASFNRAFSGGGPVFFGGMSDPMHLEVFDYRAEGDYTPKHRWRADKHSSELFADAAIAQIQENKGRPFAMWVAFTAPHDPRMAPPAYMRRYPKGSVPAPPNLMPKHPFDNGEMKVRDELLLGWPRTPEAIQNEMAAYFAMITHMDAQIGRIVKALEQAGLSKNTIVVYGADNGLAIGSHGLLGKQNLYEHSVRVPLIFSGPGIPAGRSSALCYLYDVHPTICELAGLQPALTAQGRSLLPVIRGTQAAVRDSILCAYRDVQRMICDTRWKLITYPQVQRTQLFDLSRDPHELNDLSGDARYEGRVREMFSKLLSLQKSVDDPLELNR